MVTVIVIVIIRNRKLNQNGCGETHISFSADIDHQVGISSDEDSFTEKRKCSSFFRFHVSFFLKLLFIKHFKLFYPNFSGINKQKENMHASRSYEELNDVCFEGFLTLGGGKKDNSQKFNSLRNAGQVNPFLHLGLNI